jgi:hypothetical protein
LQLWARADSLALSDGAKVSSWTDESANADHLIQATGTNQPLYRASGLNGLPAIEFTPSSDPQWLANTGCDGTLPVSGKLTVLVVAKNQTSAVYFENFPLVYPEPILFGNVLSWVFEGPWIGYQSTCISLAGPWSVVSGPPTVVMQYLPGITLLSATFDGTNLTAWRNGMLMGSDQSTVTFVSGPVCVGGALSFGVEGAWLGMVGEVIMYNRVLDASEQRGITSYLFEKWNI